ncbi:MAG: CoA-binding protein [Thermoprotei archaeon]|nr:MAG: CoA-binding protein [Thermoprotei archaeon]
MGRDSRKLEGMFKPRSVAVIGASREPHKVGHVVLKNIVEAGFKGKVYPVNPKADKILGLKAYKSVKEIPDDVDLAVIAIPAPAVPSVLEDCGRAGIKYAVVISAGFKEVGGEGIEREKKLVEAARRYGIRVVGPNCLGIMDLHTPLNAAFAATLPKRGNISFISQSGALLAAILDWSVKRGIGFSRIVSLGNKADLSEVDFLEALEEDPNTSVILLYLESIEDGRRFVEVASRVSQRKPVVLIKGGITEAGARAAMSHTGAMMGSAAALRAALRKTGVLMVSSLSELFDMAIAFSSQPVPVGNRVGVITNAGGVGVLISDFVLKRGLKLAQLSKHAIEYLRSSMPPQAAIYNPVDVLGDARADRYRKAIEVLLGDSSVDGVIVALTPQAMTEPVETAKAIAELSRKHPYKPVIAVFMGGEKVEEAKKVLLESGIPVYDMPEGAVTALFGLCKYRELKEYVEKIMERVEIYDTDKYMALSIIEKARRDKRRVLIETEAKDLVRSYGIPVVPTKLATSEDEAVRIAENLGYPVVLKIASPDILHKTDIGGVITGVESEKEVREAFKTIIANVYRYAPNARIYGVAVQKMAPKGREVIVGVSRDPIFGPLVMFGLGGVYTELFKDVSFRLAPLSLHEAREMIRDTKAYQLLRGYRGSPPADIGSVINILLRVSKLVTDIPDIVEMDINPLFVYDEGVGSLAIDVKVVVS